MPRTSRTSWASADGGTERVFVAPPVAASSRGVSSAEPDREHHAAMNSNDINPDTRFATHMMPYAYGSLNMPRHRHDSLVRHRSNVEIAGRKAAPKDLARGRSDHPTERPGEVCRIRETGSRRCIRHRRAARELTGTTLQTQPEYVWS